MSSVVAAKVSRRRMRMRALLRKRWVDLAIALIFALFPIAAGSFLVVQSAKAIALSQCAVAEKNPASAVM